MVRLELSVILLSLTTLIAASPLIPRASKFSVCDASCKGSTCATKRDFVNDFHQDHPGVHSADVAKRHLMLKDPDDPPKFYVYSRTTGGNKKKVEWNTQRTDIVSVDDKFKVTAYWDGKKNGKEYREEIDDVGGYIEGLTGCTGIAVVSEKGYWLAHIMEPAFFDDTRWKRMIDTLQNGWTASNILVLPGETGEAALAKLRAGSPKKSFTPPGAHSSYLNKANNVQIYISTTNKDAEGGSGYTTKITELERIFTTTFPGAKVNKRLYSRLTEQEHQQQGRTSAAKMLVEYTSNQLVNDEQGIYDPADPQKAMFRVWMETQNYPHEWKVSDGYCALEGSQTGGKKQGRAVPKKGKPRKSCKKTSSPVATPTPKPGKGPVQPTPKGKGPVIGKPTPKPIKPPAKPCKKGTKC